MFWKLPSPLARTMKSRRSELQQQGLSEGLAVAAPLVSLPSSTKHPSNAKRPTVADLLMVSCGDEEEGEMKMGAR
eukprot:3599585-Rhodomonas_salina.1